MDINNCTNNCIESTKTDALICVSCTEDCTAQNSKCCRCGILLTDFCFYVNINCFSFRDIQFCVSLSKYKSRFSKKNILSDNLFITV